MKFLRTASVLLVATASTALLAQPASTSLQPFTASYSVVLKGVNAGTSELELKKQADGKWLYSSRSAARGIFRMFFSEEIIQTSLVEMTGQGPRPLQYRGDEGTDATERDVKLDFDWSAGRIKGVAEDKPVELELPAGVQDPMSIQLALMNELLSGGKPAHYQMADKDKIKAYDYTYEGAARIKTALGELDTVVYSSHRSDSNKRVIRMWHAPSLGFIPVQAERTKDGKREWFMTVKTLQRGQK